jgi:hypothetical protein
MTNRETESRRTNDRHQLRAFSFSRTRVCCAPDVLERPLVLARCSHVLAPWVFTARAGADTQYPWCKHQWAFPDRSFRVVGAIDDKLFMRQSY